MEGYSRLQFVRRGAAAVGGVAAVGLLDPLTALGRSAGSPSPIPGGIKFSATPPFVTSDPDIHILPPGLIGVPLDVSAVTDFNGAVAAADIQGTAHGADGTEYSFDADMRVMQGLYVDTDDKLKKGTFGFIWIDLFTGAVGASPQITDFNPGIADNGLFWTIPIAPGMVDIDPASGSARFVGRNLPVPDYGQFENSLGGGSSIPSRVDFEVTWTATGSAVHLSSPANAFDFVADYRPAVAEITFTCSHDQSDVVYTSDPNNQGNPLPAVVGTERNGRFV